MFWAGDVFGFFGFSFMDLVSHEFVEEVTTQVSLLLVLVLELVLTLPPQVQSGSEGEPAAKRSKTMESETKSVKKEMAFVSLAESLKVHQFTTSQFHHCTISPICNFTNHQVDWSSELYAKRVRRMDPSFFLLHVLLAFRTEVHLHLYTSTPLHLCTSAPLHLCISAPLHLCTSAQAPPPLHLLHFLSSVSAPLHLHLYSFFTYTFAPAHPHLLHMLYLHLCTFCAFAPSPPAPLHPYHLLPLSTSAPAPQDDMAIHPQQEPAA